MKKYFFIAAVLLLSAFSKADSLHLIKSIYI